MTYGAAWSVLVLYSIERSRMGEVGFGLLTTATAVGGLVATAAYGWLEQRFSLALLMRACLLVETVTHLVLATTTIDVVAFVTMFFSESRPLSGGRPRGVFASAQCRRSSRAAWAAST